MPPSSEPTPAFESLTALPRFHRQVVPSEFEDYNGHMNITGYIRIHNEGSLPFMAHLGMDDEYTSVRRLSVFDLEHHLRYLHEVPIGAEVAVHGRMIDRSDKLIHGQWYLIDLDSRRLANTLEFITAHVSLESRRTVPFPDHVQARVDEVHAADLALPWPAPLGGVLGIRHH